MAKPAPIVGFTDQTMQSQSAFHTIMKAMAEPGRILSAPELVSAPAPLNPVSAMVALTLCDYDTHVWLDPDLAASPAVRQFLGFHTGAPITTQPEAANFAFISDPKHIDNLTRFAAGSDEYPDQSTTLVINVDALTNAAGNSFSGPGIETTRTFSAAPLPTSFWSMAKANHALYPRGVDMIFCNGASLACLPRSTRITGA